MGAKYWPFHTFVLHLEKLMFESRSKQASRRSRGRRVGIAADGRPAHGRHVRIARRRSQAHGRRAHRPPELHGHAAPGHAARAAADAAGRAVAGAAGESGRSAGRAAQPLALARADRRPRGRSRHRGAAVALGWRRIREHDGECHRDRAARGDRHLAGPQVHEPPSSAGAGVFGRRLGVVVGRLLAKPVVPAGRHRQQLLG